MSLEIPHEIEEMAQSIFRNGQYESESDVIREPLGLLRRRDLLRGDINEGSASVRTRSSRNSLRKRLNLAKSVQ
jgi:Arc/MetJ-type ribon-helix-helix transcriptional regulator